MAIRMRLPALRAVLPTPARAAAPILARRAFGTTTRRTDVLKSTTKPPPMVGTGAKPQIDMMTGEVTGGADLDPSRLTIEQNMSPKEIPPSSTLSFGRTFTDHMMCIPWNVETGWGAPEIKPYGPLAIDPSSTVLHYAPCLFEGMKAYKDAETDTARLFRPDKNMERMTRSAARLAFPTFSGDHLITLIKKLVEVDKKWIPTDPGTSLYIRPTMIGVQAGLGVGASSDVLLFIISEHLDSGFAQYPDEFFPCSKVSPVGPYYKTGFKPIKLLATTTDVRAFPGGTGSFKLGSNYAGGVVPQMKAAALGYSQILWLFGPDHQLTEVGTSNLFISLKHPDGTVELVTPPLEDLILPGVTRDSVLALTRAHADPSNPLRIEGLPEKFIVSERHMNMSELVAASKDGSLLEVFGTGTAAIVTACDGIGYDGQEIPVPCGPSGLGNIAEVCLREIQGRQTGTIESEWSFVV
ncbi:branched-chain amino acid aminotransferase, partial [Phenoliferia sp. Uapishka_3]